MTTVRRPAVAGRFYPDQADSLASTVERLLDDARAARIRQAQPPVAPPAQPSPPTYTQPATEAPVTPQPKALIVPHAGYIYSGSTAAEGYLTLSHLPLSHRPITRVVLLGPAHYVRVNGLALSGSDAFATPLGEVPLDTGLEAILADLPQVVTDPIAHGPEHSLEVQLPFLQRVLGEFTLVPLVVGNATPEQVAGVLEVAWGGPETLVVISSDLSHYLPYEQARARDQDTVRRILSLAWPLPDRSACGARPVNGLLVTAQARGLRPTLLGLRNSGDTAGDRDRVVGYTAIAWEPSDGPA